MSARISKMYKLSGGCKVGKTCGECRYFIPSDVRPKEFRCRKHGEDGTYWKGAWLACKEFKNPIRKRQPKLKEESTGQMSLVLN